MKDVALVNVVAVRQAGLNGQNSKQYCEGENRAPRDPGEDTAFW